MKPKITTILVLMLLPMIGQAQRQQYQQVNDILYTASSDAYAQERKIRVPNSPERGQIQQVRHMYLPYYPYHHQKPQQCSWLHPH